MKPQWLARFLVGALVLMPVGLSSHSLPNGSQQSSPPAKTGNNASASTKDELPFPQVPRITAEQVMSLMKEKGKVVLVDTDDAITYEAEHIQGAINITYDPSVALRSADDMLNALPGDKMIVFYCNCPHEEDSAPMVMEMWELNYDRANVKALQGGLARWEQLGYPLAGTDLPKKSN
ncbi:MAG: rhodanese-like domain-containing protein [Acidobacteriia bacterium]|nr:rhodanese-like domain-containing protein [Terriglobia bacterium]